MKKLSISLPSMQQRDYPIFIGSNLVGEISSLFPLEGYTKILVLTDTNIAPFFLDKVLSSLQQETQSLTIAPGEKEKKFETIQTIWKKLHEIGADRKSLLINLGGGVIGDMGGFAASTYMRGIDFINLPTTLLSQVDSSVGGKTGFDFAGIKNLIGTFTQPKAVIIDVETVKTLPKREFLSGFAEIIKHGAIQDKNYFVMVTGKDPLSFSSEELIEIITRSCEIKSEIIQHDETETGQRKLLNFGHTVGHAVEALRLETDTPLLHGEAVSIGMVAEATIATEMGLLREQDTQMLKDKLESAGLPVSIPKTLIPPFNKGGWEDFITKMKSDKKNTDGNINFTLLSEIGNGIINQTASEEIIRKVLQK